MNAPGGPDGDSGAVERRLFGTDGVRGTANAELTPELAFDLGRAAGEAVEGPVVVARDTRRSGQMLTSALVAGFNSVGVDTVDLGIVPVGAVSRLGRDLDAHLGVMVSASHNPAEDNGIKFFGRGGVKLSDAEEAAIEERLRRGAPWRQPIGPKVGIQQPLPDALERYLDRITARVRYNMRGLEFALDCANGAAFLAAPRLVERVGATAVVFADAPDGMNINAGCGATHAGFLAARADGRLGFAFDGDADRLVAVDEDGAVADGDVVMAVLAAWLKQQGKLANDTVVVTVMSNLGFREAMRRLGITVVETPVGDRYVVEAMRRTRAVLGGEQSGHVLLEDRTTGDGLRTALRLMEVVAGTGKELRELRRIMEAYPQILRNVRVADKGRLTDDPQVARAIVEAEHALGERGRILVRPSGTEPVVRVMVEAPSQGEAETVADAVAEVVAQRLG